MDIISAEEWQLTSFFEVVPTCSDPDSPWPYNEVVYEVERRELFLSCAIAPAHRDIQLIIRSGELLKYELSATQVNDVVYANDSTGEYLRIMLSDFEHIELRLKPLIKLTHKADYQFR